MQSNNEYRATYGTHMQQVKQLLLKGVVKPKTIWELLQDLKKIIMEHHSTGGGVVLIIDANE